MQPPLLDRIRDYTSLCHKDIEEKFDVFNRVKGLGDYEKLLLKLYQFYSPLEDKLFKFNLDFSNFGLILSKRRKTELLKNDMGKLAIDFRVEVIKEKNAELPLVDHFGKAVGVLYVLEGSTLGSQFICKYLQSLAQLDGKVWPLSFYVGYGPATGQMWKDFGTFLTQYSEQIKCEDEVKLVLSSAKSTFELLGRWLSSLDVSH